MEEPAQSNCSRPESHPPASAVLGLLVVLSVLGSGVYVFCSFCK